MLPDPRALATPEHIHNNLQCLTFKFVQNMYLADLEKLLQKLEEESRRRAKAAMDSFTTLIEDEKLTEEERKVSPGLQSVIEKYTACCGQLNIDQIDILPASNRIGVFAYKPGQQGALEYRLRPVEESKVMLNKLSMEAKGFLANKELIVGTRATVQEGQQLYYLIDGYHRVTAMKELYDELNNQFCRESQQNINENVYNMFKQPDGSFRMVLKNVRILRFDTPLKLQVQIGEGLNEAEMSANSGTGWIQRTMSFLKKVEPQTEEARTQMTQKSLFNDLQRPSGMSARLFSTTTGICRGLVQYRCEDLFCNVMNAIAFKFTKNSPSSIKVKTIQEVTSGCQRFMVPVLDDELAAIALKLAMFEPKHEDFTAVTGNISFFTHFLDSMNIWAKSATKRAEIFLNFENFPVVLKVRDIHKFLGDSTDMLKGVRMLKEFFFKTGLYKCNLGMFVQPREKVKDLPATREFWNIRQMSRFDYSADSPITKRYDMGSRLKKLEHCKEHNDMFIRMARSIVDNFVGIFWELFKRKESYIVKVLESALPTMFVSMSDIKEIIERRVTQDRIRVAKEAEQDKLEQRWKTVQEERAARSVQENRELEQERLRESRATIAAAVTPINKQARTSQNKEKEMEQDQPMEGNNSDDDDEEQEEEEEEEDQGKEKQSESESESEEQEEQQETPKQKRPLVYRTPKKRRNKKQKHKSVLDASSSDEDKKEESKSDEDEGDQQEAKSDEDASADEESSEDDFGLVSLYREIEQPVRERLNKVLLVKKLPKNSRSFQQYDNTEYAVIPTELLKELIGNKEK